jgi:predicted O-methyltransferase YrrM
MPDRTPAFAEVWTTAKAIGGWLTEAQGRVLFEAVAALPGNAHVVEIGSHQGRSTVVLAGRPDVRITAIDPFVPGRMFGGPAARDAFEANLRAAGARGRVRLLQARSGDLRPGWTAPVDLVYVDGKHDYWTVADDLRWADLLEPGRRLFLHDCFSSIGVTLAVLRHVLPGRRLVYETRTGSLAAFRVGRPTHVDRLRLLLELPWWLRNVVIKVLLRVKLRRVSAWLGHGDVFDPY